MRKLIYGVLLFGASLWGQTFDVYGGLLSKPCTNTTGFFTTSLQGNRWLFCTPTGHLFYYQAMSGADAADASSSSYSSIATAKYGDITVTWGPQMVRRVQAWGFNALGQKSSNYMSPTATDPSWPGDHTQPAKIPQFLTMEVSVYAAANLWGKVTSGVKDVMWGMNANCCTSGWRNTHVMDFFDPSFINYVTAYLNDSSQVVQTISPWTIGTFADDTDWFWGMGAGPNFGSPAGNSHTNDHPGFMTLISSPIQEFNPGATLYGGIAQLYADNRLFSKVAMDSVPATCGIGDPNTNPLTVGPCSLRDYLVKKYSSVQSCASGATGITGLNNCWGTSGYYTTFDSSGTRHTSVALTAAADPKVFTATLTGPVSPLSVAIKVGGQKVGGDCPWFVTCSVSSNGTITGPSAIWRAGTSVYRSSYIVDSNGNLQQSTQAAGAANTGGSAPTWNNTQGGTTTDGSVTWTNIGKAILAKPAPWLQGMSTVVGQPAYPAAAWFPITVYHYSDPTIHGSPSRSNASNRFAAGTQPTVLNPASGGSSTDPTATGYDVYMSCQITSGAATFGCAASTDPQPAPTLQASNIPIGTDWTVPNTGLVSGSALPAASSSINYTTGAVSVQFAAAPGVTPTIDYTESGWMYGTGLMDEDGRNTSWIGTNSICLTAEGVCNGGEKGSPNMNANAAADIEDWLKQFGGQYFRSIERPIHTKWPGFLYFGPDNMGTWGTPTRKQLYQAAAPYLDGQFPDVDLTYADANARWSFAFQYLPRPAIFNMSRTAIVDSSVWFNADPGVSNTSTTITQEMRGQNYYDSVVNALNTNVGPDGVHYWVGHSWWGLTDFDYGGEINNWGLVTINDNPYDGSHACTAGTGVTTETINGVTYTRTDETTVPGAWQANTSYTVPVNLTAVGSEIWQNVGGTVYIFVPTVGGTSSSSPPTWPITLDATVSDGTVTWRNRGSKINANPTACYGDVLTKVVSANALWQSLSTGGVNSTIPGGRTIPGGSVLH